MRYLLTALLAFGVLAGAGAGSAQEDPGAAPAATLFVPVITTVARRGGAMAIALEVNQSAQAPSAVQLEPLDIFDLLLAVAAAASLAAAIGARSGLLGSL